MGGRAPGCRIPATVADPLIKEFRYAVLAGLASIPRIPGPKHSTVQHPGRDLLEFCRDGQADVLRFTTDTQIWPTNNISEHGVRPNKTQQKISGRLTSEDATQDRLDIRSYIDTARKHGRNIITVLHGRAASRVGPRRRPGSADRVLRDTGARVDRVHRHGGFCPGRRRRQSARSPALGCLHRFSRASAANVQ